MSRSGWAGPHSTSSARCFVGTIHAYCFRLLQQHVPRYETYDVLDDNQLTAFLCREATRLNIKRSGRTGCSRRSRAFLANVDVVENELIPASDLTDPFRGDRRGYFDAATQRYRFLTFGQQIVRAVEALRDPAVAAIVHGDLRHLIVDEYQDVNPAQERLIELLTGPEVELCVVGDDDQAIYQWRGSDVAQHRSTSPSATRTSRTFRITTNRRSRPGIIAAANAFAESIPGRLPKTMAAVRARIRRRGRALVGRHRGRRGRPDRRDDRAPARRTASATATSPSSSVAGRVPGAADRLRAARHPRPARRRTGLFDQPEARLLGRPSPGSPTSTGARAATSAGTVPTDDDLLDGFQALFEPSFARRGASCVAGSWPGRHRSAPPNDRREPRRRALRPAR